MIGVAARPDQTGVVAEFFELFKTPWEFYRPGRVYDVVIVTADEIPQVNAKLLLVYGAGAKNIDATFGMMATGQRHRAVLNDGDRLVPVYGQITTFADGSKGVPFLTADCGTAGLRFDFSGSVLVRLGYDLFDEVHALLVTGQPVEHAHIPTLDLHIRMLRNWILNEGIALVEIAPVPAGHNFAVCLTHDIDFVGMRNHKFDHTMFGFLYRATAGSVFNLLRRRISFSRFLKTWRAVASLPFVLAGWAKDFWEPFEWYLQAEKGLSATYFLIPFKRFAGENVRDRHASRRASSYDITDVLPQTAVLRKQGCEIGVHGIDAWHNAERGREEMARTTAVTGEPNPGIRMHWLLADTNTASLLEQAGFAYDSTCGYNETAGYRAGTGQVFRPLSAQTLLELPLHIQDGALFFPERLDLSEAEAEERCQTLIDHAVEHGGVLTVLWHDRSHGPERFWGDFYIRLLGLLKVRDAWFGTAAQVVNWFRKRREVRFERAEDPGIARYRLRYEGDKIHPALMVRVYAQRRSDRQESAGRTRHAFSDFAWNGESAAELEAQIAARLLAPTRDLALSTLS